MKNRSFTISVSIEKRSLEKGNSYYFRWYDPDTGKRKSEHAGYDRKKPIKAAGLSRRKQGLRSSRDRLLQWTLYGHYSFFMVLGSSLIYV